MESTPKQQILRTLKDAKNILLLSHQQIDGDGIGAMIALYLAFQKMGKQATAFSFDPVPGALDFLPRVKDYLHNEINSYNDFIITIDCSNTKVDKIKYNAQDNKVNIIVTPKDGNFSGSDISTTQGKGQYDCVIVLDTGDIQQLGKIYKDNPKLFYDVPVINIDHHVTNTFFGTINLVDPKSTSTCEIILGILEALESQTKTKLLDSTIATYLLTGITVDTGSFQNSNTTPKAFSVAAQLLALGADQQTIIKNLYKTHKLSKLKLWGYALSHIKEDKETNLVWSTLSRQDFTDSEASDDEVEGVIDELITSAPGADIVFLLRERNDGVVACSIRTLDSTDASRLAMLFNGGGHKRAAGFKIKGDTLEKIENFVVKKFRDYKKGLIELPSESRKEQMGDEGAPFETIISAEAESFISEVQKKAQSIESEVSPIEDEKIIEMKNSEEVVSTQKTDELFTGAVEAEILSTPEEVTLPDSEIKKIEEKKTSDVVDSEDEDFEESDEDNDDDDDEDEEEKLENSKQNAPHVFSAIGGIQKNPEIVPNNETTSEMPIVQTQFTAAPQVEAVQAQDIAAPQIETPAETISNNPMQAESSPFVQTQDVATPDQTPFVPMQDIVTPNQTPFVPMQDAVTTNETPFVQTQDVASLAETSIPDVPNPHAMDYMPTNTFPPVQTQFTAAPQEENPFVQTQDVGTPDQTPFVQTQDVASLSTTPSFDPFAPTNSIGIPPVQTQDVASLATTPSPTFTNSEDDIPDFQPRPELPSQPINSNDDSSDPFSRPSVNR